MTPTVVSAAAKHVLAQLPLFMCAGCACSCHTRPLLLHAVLHAVLTHLLVACEGHRGHDLIHHLQQPALVGCDARCKPLQAQKDGK